MIRRDTYTDGALIERVEVTREPDGSVRFHRYDGDLAVMEERIATDAEVERLAAQEEGEREQDIRTKAENALTTLRTQYDNVQQILDGDANNINQVNTALDILANSVQTLQRISAHLIRLEVRRLDSTEL